MPDLFECLLEARITLIEVLVRACQVYPLARISGRGAEASQVQISVSHADLSA